jgi:hypothetical protein
MKRIFLLIATNIAILVVISILLYVTGADRFIQGSSLDPNCCWLR